MEHEYFAITISGVAVAIWGPMGRMELRSEFLELLGEVPPEDIRSLSWIEVERLPGEREAFSLPGLVVHKHG